eukprot:COSAG05_NODE_180_length_14817_cov_423.925262_13_plen_105_part_00
MFLFGLVVCGISGVWYGDCQCAAHVTSKGGAVPTGGAQEWWCYAEGEWTKCRMTVQELTPAQAASRQQRFADEARSVSFFLFFFFLCFSDRMMSAISPTSCDFV